jgi:XTP/dITP diphosphohydrolase
LVFATRNAGKLREARELLAALPIRLRGLADLPVLELPPEGADYGANAAAKALAAARASGRLALGDDSGLEVDALGGAPGASSARFGGPGADDTRRNGLLLAALAGVPAARRGARFVCVVALATPEGEVETARGSCAGRILEAPRGVGGFGYDPVFEVAQLGRAMAELAPAEKHGVSHRGRAFRALEPVLRGRLGGRLESRPASGARSEP